MEKTYIKLSGATVYTEIKGQGEPVLMLHAGIADSRMWNEEFSLLSAKFRIIRLDIPGYGESKLTGKSFVYHEIIKEVLDYFSIERAHIIAASFGATITIDFCLLHPDKCKKLILFSPVLRGWKVSEMLATYEKRQERLLKERKYQEAAQYNYDTWIVRGRDGKVLSDKRKDLWFSMQRKAWERQVPDYAQPVVEIENHLEHISEIKQPLLIINGALDIPDFLTMGELLFQGAPYSKRVIIPNTAHLPNLEAPFYTTPLITLFLQEESSGSFLQ
jgi:3-oxoadipate enol-lactonase